MWIEKYVTVESEVDIEIEFSDIEDNLHTFGDDELLRLTECIQSELDRRAERAERAKERKPLTDKERSEYLNKLTEALS